MPGTRPMFRVSMKTFKDSWHALMDVTADENIKHDAERLDVDFCF